MEAQSYWRPLAYIRARLWLLRPPALMALVRSARRTPCAGAPTAWTLPPLALEAPSRLSDSCQAPDRRESEA